VMRTTACSTFPRASATSTRCPRPGAHRAHTPLRRPRRL
jgi:hypothetical protein